MNILHETPTADNPQGNVNLKTFDPNDKTGLLWLEDGRTHDNLTRLYGREIPATLRIDLEYLIGLTDLGIAYIVVSHRTQPGWKSDWIATYGAWILAILLDGEIIIDRNGESWVEFPSTCLHLLKKPQRRRRTARRQRKAVRA